MRNEAFFHNILDLFLTALALWVAYYVNLWLRVASGGALFPVGFPFLLLITLICCGLSLEFFGCYDLNRRQAVDRIFLCVSKCVLSGALGVCLLLYLLQLTEGSHLLIALFIATDIFLLTTYRALIHVRRKRGLNRREILLIGGKERARELIRYVVANEELGYHIIGCLDLSLSSVGDEVAEGVEIIGTLQDFRRLLLERAVDEVIFAIPLKRVDGVVAYISFAEEQGVNVRVLPDWQIPELLYQPKIASVYIEPFVGLPTLALSSVPRKKFSLLIKSVLDRCSAFLGLVALFPLFLVVAVMIKRTSEGPVFFRQQRCGLNGRVFTLYKFRTMIEDAEQLMERLQVANEVDGPVFKIEKDPRLTRAGKFLRKTSIDELPQLINVMRGDMSLVGPRPPLPSEVKEYSHWQRRRLSMKPGLTCIWQVSGRNSICFEEWMRMDLDYIDKWSLLLDCKLLLKTVPAVIFGTGK